MDVPDDAREPDCIGKQFRPRVPPPRESTSLSDSDPVTAFLDNIRIVMVETSHPGNIGSAARAMKTMGLTRLTLVEPKCHPGAEARALASGADDVLRAIAIADSLEEALADCVFAVAATARPRDLSPTRLDARGAAAQVAEMSALGPVALVFGNETSGLSNDHVRRCNLAAYIPVNPEYSSLNLAAAVQVFAYELRMVAGTLTNLPDRRQDVAATQDEIERLFSHAEVALAAIGFFDPANPKRLFPRLRRLAGRARLEREEVDILRGMLAFAAQARQGPVDGESE